MRRQRVERGGVGDLPAIKAYAFAGIGIDDQALLAVVHAERARGAAFVDKLHAEKTRRIGRPLVDIAGADPNIAERLQEHGVFSLRACYQIPADWRILRRRATEIASARNILAGEQF